MVKDNAHKTRALLYQDQEIPLSHHSEAFQLVTRIQDEVHRFAITYHRKLREDAMLHSVLEDIPRHWACPAESDYGAFFQY